MPEAGGDLTHPAEATLGDRLAKRTESGAYLIRQLQLQL